MPQLRVCMLQLRPDTANQVNKNKIFKIKAKKTQNTIWINIYILYIYREMNVRKTRYFNFILNVFNIVSLKNKNMLILSLIDGG